jgi:ribulose-phosphate 3-epimerase
MVLIAPSILAADFLHLQQEIKAIEDAGADHIHVDVMDGHFVPNLTMGPVIISSIKKVTKLPIDVHLMITNANCYIDTYIDSGADLLTIHQESSLHI